MRKRKGDTLIEVTLAVGIFSLVAIAVVAVVNGSTSGAQSALETTLAREEIDIQAEALRFIQSSYANSDAVNGGEADLYQSLWREIKDHTINSADSMEYNPVTCQELYDSGEGTKLNPITNQKAFIINPRKLGSTSSTNEIIVTASSSASDPFHEASTYPRIMYGNVTDNTDEGEIFGGEEQTNIYRIEGIYVVGVKGPKTLVVDNSGSVKNSIAYYDFYIRSCWYVPGAETPSTISTVMRLYDPDVVKVH